MNRVILNLALILTSISLQAQHEFGISVNAGTSLLSVENELQSSFSEHKNITTVHSPSFTTDFSYAFRKNNFSFETGLGYTFIAGRYYSIVNVTNVEDGSITTMKSEKEHRTNYASIPLLLNYHFNKLTLGVGTQLLYNISGNLSNSIYSSRQAAAYDLLSITKRGSALSTLDYGALFKANYLLTSRFSVQARAYFGLSDISNNNEKGAAYDIYQLDDPLNRSKLANRQFTIGLKYLIKG